MQPPIGRDGDSFFARPVGDNPCLKAFARYRPIPVSRATLVPELLVVLPEALGHIWARFAPAQVAIWWLAVDSVLNREANALAPAYQAPYRQTCSTFVSRLTPETSSPRLEFGGFGF
ncbi:MAG: hypothetical protein KY449_09785 [Proteobacteria bacterium]|nr:hypothetical protein [Pseudomonadota bacterium]